MPPVKVLVRWCLVVLVGSALAYCFRWKTDRLVSHAERLLAGGDHDGAVLMARSAFARDSDDERVRAILTQAYEAKRDPRVLELLTGDQLASTLKAIELGVELQARETYSRLMPGRTVDALWMP